VTEASVEEARAIQSVLNLMSLSVVPVVQRNRRVGGKSNPMALTNGPHHGPVGSEWGSMEESLCAEHVQIVDGSLVALRGLAMDDHDQAHMFEVVGQPG
jgi:hypothetical protein